MRPGTASVAAMMNQRPASRSYLIFGSERIRAGAHRRKERVGREIQDLVGSRRRLGKTSDLPVGRDDELRRPGGTARIGRQRAGLAESRADEALQERHRLAGIEVVGGAGHHLLRAAGPSRVRECRSPNDAAARSGHVEGGRERLLRLQVHEVLARGVADARARRLARRRLRQDRGRAEAARQNGEGGRGRKTERGPRGADTAGPDTVRRHASMGAQLPITEMQHE